jgi:hypothetical protein
MRCLEVLRVLMQAGMQHWRMQQVKLQAAAAPAAAVLPAVLLLLVLLVVLLQG